MIFQREQKITYFMQQNVHFYVGIPCRTFKKIFIFSRQMVLLWQQKNCYSFNALTLIWTLNGELVFFMRKKTLFIFRSQHDFM